MTAHPSRHWAPSSLPSFPLPVLQSLPSLSLALEQLTEVVFYRGAGTGGLGLAIEGPSEAKMSCKDNKDGSCTVEYIPFTPGDYDVNITFGGQPIPGGQRGRMGWALGSGLWEEDAGVMGRGGCGDLQRARSRAGGGVAVVPL